MLSYASDYYDHSFGKAHGLLINEGHLLARAVLVLDAQTTSRADTSVLTNINSWTKYDVPHQLAFFTAL